MIQLDYRTFNQATLRQNNGTGAALGNGFDVRLVRPTFQGTVFGKYDFRFTPEFAESDVQSAGNNSTAQTSSGATVANNNKARIVDAYVEGRYQPWLKVRVGKFTPYVGLERLQANEDTKWIERSYISNNITPTRDLGISVGGDVLSNKLNYAVGVYNGVIDGGESGTGVDGNNNKDIALRLFATPFRDDVNALQGLGFGIAGTYGTANGNFAASNLPSYKTPGQQLNFFSYTTGAVRATGTHLRIVPQAYYYYGPLGVIAEYASVEQGVQNTANTKANLENDAWQVAVSYLLTGEDASYKGVKPKSAFNTDGSGWGAWEIVARYQENNIDDGAFNTSTAAAGARYASPIASAKSAKTWGIGLNWYLNQWVKVATDYEQTTFDGGAGTTVGTAYNISDRADERILFSRLQLSF